MSWNFIKKMLRVPWEVVFSLKEGVDILWQLFVYVLWILCVICFMCIFYFKCNYFIYYVAFHK